MKNFVKTTMLVFLLVFLSCVKEDNDSAGEESDKLAEKLESTPLEANLVSDNVIIKGALKKRGNPPTPNRAIFMELLNSGKVALLNEGFELKLSSNANITGAYLQFKGKDDTVASSYYDINLSKNRTYSKSEKATRSKKANSMFSRTSEKRTLDIDFSNKIPPGTFCYSICVYDEEGNISKPEEVCATVESWGGNSAIVGTWDFVKLARTEDGVTKTTLVGEKYIYEGSITCENGEKISYSNYFITKKITLVMAADGTYNLVLNEEERERERERDIDYDASNKDCSVVYKTSLYTERGEGKWAYVVADKHLTMVKYKNSKEDSEGRIESETYPPGEGELVLDGTIELDGNSLVISVEDDDGDGYVEYVKLYFKRK